MKYVYVLVSGIGDVYYEQALVSVTSLKMHMPDAYVTLIVDDLTAKTLVESRSKIKELINEFVVIDLDKNMKQIAKSRQLKTSMRNLINGDFLYIDSDTVITNDLSSIFAIDCEIGAVLDLHSKISERIYVEYIYSQFKKVGFSSYKNDYFFNSGVIYVKDTKNTRAFFKRWNELWYYCTSKNCYFDQYALTETDCEYGYIIKELPGEYNCQIECGINYLTNAKIIHFYYNAIRIKPYHIFMDTKIYYDVKNKAISEEVMNVIRNAKNSFYKNALITCAETGIMDTNIYGFLYSLYNRFRFAFNILDMCVVPIFKIAKIFRKMYISLKRKEKNDT